MAADDDARILAEALRRDKQRKEWGKKIAQGNTIRKSTETCEGAADTGADADDRGPLVLPSQRVSQLKRVRFQLPGDHTTPTSEQHDTELPISSSKRIKRSCAAPAKLMSLEPPMPDWGSHGSIEAHELATQVVPCVNAEIGKEALSRRNLAGEPVCATADISAKARECARNQTISYHTEGIGRCEKRIFAAGNSSPPPSAPGTEFDDHVPNESQEEAQLVKEPSLVTHPSLASESVPRPKRLRFDAVVDSRESNLKVLKMTLARMDDEDREKKENSHVPLRPGEQSAPYAQPSIASSCAASVAEISGSGAHSAPSLGERIKGKEGSRRARETTASGVIKQPWPEVLTVNFHKWLEHLEAEEWRRIEAIKAALTQSMGGHIKQCRAVTRKVIADAAMAICEETANAATAIATEKEKLPARRKPLVKAYHQVRQKTEGLEQLAQAASKSAAAIQSAVSEENRRLARSSAGIGAKLEEQLQRAASDYESECQRIDQRSDAALRSNKRRALICGPESSGSLAELLQNLQATAGV